MTTGEERHQMTTARKALARMQDIPRGWQDKNTYHRISIPHDVRKILMYLGPVGDIDGRFTCAFNRLKENTNVAVMEG